MPKASGANLSGQGKPVYLRILQRFGDPVVLHTFELKFLANTQGALAALNAGTHKKTGKAPVINKAVFFTPGEHGGQRRLVTQPLLQLGDQFATGMIAPGQQGNRPLAQLGLRQRLTHRQPQLPLPPALQRWGPAASAHGFLLRFLRQ